MMRWLMFASLLFPVAIQGACASAGAVALARARPGSHPVALTWVPQPQPEGVTISSQRLYRNATNCSQPSQTVTRIGPGITTFLDSAVKSHRTYSYWLTVDDQNGVESRKSNCVTATIP
jgi:hypothetical protein